MRRTTCLWLLAFLALGSAIPVPGPASQQELMDMILNAKPEDNDIDIQSISPQPLINETEVEGKVHGNPETQESIIPEGVKEEIITPSETTQEVSETDQVQEVPEAANVETDSIQEELEPEPVQNVDQTQLNQEESLLVPEEEDVQVQPEELTPIIAGEPVQLNPYEEQIFPLPEEEQVPFDEDEQSLPVPADQIFFVTEEERATPVPEEEHLFAVIEEDQIVPIYDEEIPVESYDEEQTFAIREETEFQPDSEDTMIMNFQNDEETPIAEEPGHFQGAIIVDLEEPALGQPISEETIIPDSVYEELPQDDVMTYPEEDESVFGSFVPPYFGEDPQPGEILVLDEEPQGPVYFETFDDVEPVPVGMPVVPEDIMEMPVEMPVEQVPPFAISDINEDPSTNTEVISFEVFPVQSSGIPYEHSLDDIIEDYYIPEESDEVTDDYREAPFLENESEVYGQDDIVPDNQASQEETIVILDGPSSEVFQIMPEGPNEDSFIAEKFVPEYDQTSVEVEQEPTMSDIMTEVEATDIVLNYPVLDSGMMSNEDLPFQNGGDLMPAINQQNFPRPAELEETMFMTDPQIFGEEGEEPIIEIIRLEDLPQTLEPIPFGVPLSEAAGQQIIDDEQIVPIAEFPEMDNTPIIIEEDRNPIQQPMIFPEEMPPKHNLPVFPYQWSEENFFRHPNDGHVQINNPAPSFELPNEPSTLHDQPIESSYNSPPPFQGSSYGPPLTPDQSYEPNSEPFYYGPSPPQVPSFDPSSETVPSNDFHQNPFMMGQPQPIIDMLNDDMSPHMADIMPPSEVPDFDIFDDEDLDMDDPTDHFHFSSDVFQNSRFSDVPKRFDDFDSFELPSLPEISFQQDFQGPNTFPLNFRGSDFTPHFLSVNLNPFKQRITAQDMNQENLPGSFASPQSFQQDPSPPHSPNTRPFSPNTFLPIFSEAVRNPTKENMNRPMSLQVFETSSMPMNHPKTNQRQQQQYDVQVSFIPYETSFSFQPKNGPGYFDSRYPSGLQHDNAFNRYHGFPPYNFPTYGEPAPYQQSDSYPPEIIKYRYAMGYNNFRDQFDHYHPYNYHNTPAW